MLGKKGVIIVIRWLCYGLNIMEENLVFFFYRDNICFLNIVDVCEYWLFDDEKLLKFR